MLNDLTDNKMKKLSDLSVKMFADGAEKSSMLELYSNPIIKGFTTNPTLMSWFWVLLEDFFIPFFSSLNRLTPYYRCHLLPTRRSWRPARTGCFLVPDEGVCAGSSKAGEN